MAHKNLSYESKEPAFLQRLRAQTAGVHQERPLNRPKKQRNPEDDEEDEPVYVLEDNTTLSGKEFEAMKEETVAKAKASEEEEIDGDKASKNDPEDKSKATKNEKPKDSVLEVGVKTQKRKIAKVVGAETSGDEAKKGDEKDKKDDAPKKRKARPKQKVKLSFGDD